MSLALGPTESANSVDSDYCAWRLDSILVEIHIHAGVIDGIRRDIFENARSSTTGVLLGHGEPGDPAILWIERYRRVGEEPPDSEQGSFVVGAYWGSALSVHPDEPPAFPEGASEFLLRIAPGPSGILQAQCFFQGATGSPEAALPLFPFQGRALETPPADTTPERHADQHRPGRLVPDFDRAGGPPRPAAEFFGEPGTDSPFRLFRRFWPVLTAIALVVAVVWLLLVFQTGGRALSPATSVATRPLGLYVDPSAPIWRISWNRDATVLRDAKGVRLFVKDGDDQNLLELSAQDLAAAAYRYEARGRDITFRLEATGKDGRVTAESFRLLRTAAPETPKSLPAGSALSLAGTTPPRASYRVAPVVAAGIRPRIHGKMGIDVRVQIDRRGRVTAAAPTPKPQGTLEVYLAARAVQAARAWRFHPAIKDGKPVSGTQIIHFMFER
ncbi:MAG: energy transducer TonB [Acidobacteriota bacterium]